MTPPEGSRGKSAHEIAVDFAERFQKNYPTEPIFNMLDDLRKEIQKFGREQYLAGSEEMRSRFGWLLDERHSLYDSRSTSNIHSFIRQCKELLSRIPVVYPPALDEKEKSDG